MSHDASGGASVEWTLPVPSTALFHSPAFEMRPRRTVALRFAYERDDDTRCLTTLVFSGVEAFKCTHYRARDAEALVAYDKLVDLGPTPWLEQLRANLKTNGGDADGLVHRMINFDDGPCYEVVCRSFEVAESTSPTDG